MEMKNIARWLIFTASLYIHASYAELFEYRLSGKFQLEDISCKLSDLNEIDYDNVSEYSFSVVMYGDTTAIQRTPITGFGDLDTIELIEGALFIDGVGYFPLYQAKIRSLNQTGILGFSWGGTETSIEKSILFYGTSRLLNEEAENDPIYFDSVNSISPNFTLSNLRTYQIISSNNVFYSSYLIDQIPEIIFIDEPSLDNLCFGNIDEPELIIEPPRLDTVELNLDSDAKGSSGSLNLVSLLLLFLFLYLRQDFISRTVSRTNLRF